jgi:hypothetical protein
MCHNGLQRQSERQSMRVPRQAAFCQLAGQTVCSILGIIDSGAAQGSSSCLYMPVTMPQCNSGMLRSRRQF